MGLREKIKNRIKKTVGKFSGEYSEPAHEAYTGTYGRGHAGDEVDVVMAKVTRPGNAAVRKKQREEGEEEED